MKNPYLPRTEKQRVVWLQNFYKKLGNYELTLNFTADEVIGVGKDAVMYSYIINQSENSKTDAKKLTDFKNALSSGSMGSELGVTPTVTVTVPPDPVPAGIFTRLSGMVQRIKSHPKYTLAMGNDLGIIGSDHTIDPASIKPTLNLRLAVGKPYLKWKKAKRKKKRTAIKNTSGYFGLFYSAH